MHRPAIVPRTGFTLMEMLVVVSLIALVSSMAVGLYQGVGEDSSEKVSIANQQELLRAVASFQTLNRGRGVDRLDSLIDYGTPAGAAGTWAGSGVLNSAVAVGGVYRGVKTADVAGTPIDAISRARNLGIADPLAAQVGVYYLSSADLDAVRAAGLASAWYHNLCALPANAVLAANPLDGTAVTAETGLQPGASAAFKTALAAGSPVLAIDPLAGQDLYRAFGEDLLLPAAPAPTAAAAQAAARAAGVLLLFGCGDQCSAVGARAGGMTAVPRCEALSAEWYRNYLLVLRLPAAGEPPRAAVVGVLDPLGRSVAAARLVNDRRRGG